VRVGDRSRSAGADRTFLAFVLDQLGGLGRIESRAMFGGHGIYLAGTFFAILWRGRLFFYTDAVTRADYQARGMMPFRPRVPQTLERYYEVPADVLEDATQAARWARAAVAAAAARSPVRRRRPR